MTSGFRAARYDFWHPVSALQSIPWVEMKCPFRVILPRRSKSRVKATRSRTITPSIYEKVSSQSSAVLPIVQNGIHAVEITQSFR